LSKFVLYLFVINSLFFAFSSFGSEEKSKSLLEIMFEQDQNDLAKYHSDLKNKVFFEKQQARRWKVFELLVDGKITTKEDKFFAALILQHTPKRDDAIETDSFSSENHILSYYLNVSAHKENEPDSGWYAAAAMDRYLRSIGQLQKYGTFWSEDPTTGLYIEVEPTSVETTDRERESLDIPKLKDMPKKIREINDYLRAEQENAN